MKTAIIVATALATLTATPVLAQTYRAANDGGPTSITSSPAVVSPQVRRAARSAYAAVPESYAAAAGVYSYDRYAGWDPDPAIRLQLRRDPIGGNSQ